MPPGISRARSARRHALGRSGLLEEVARLAASLMTLARRPDARSSPSARACRASGTCFTSRPLPSTSGTRPALPTVRTASRAPMPVASGTRTALGARRTDAARDAAHVRGRVLAVGLGAAARAVDLHRGERRVGDISIARHGLDLRCGVGGRDAQVAQARLGDAPEDRACEIASVAPDHRLVEHDRDDEARLVGRHEADERRRVLVLGVLARRGVDLLRGRGLAGDAEARHRGLDAGAALLDDRGEHLARPSSRRLPGRPRGARAASTP